MLNGDSLVVKKLEGIEGHWKWAVVRNLLM